MAGLNVTLQDGTVVKINVGERIDDIKTKLGGNVDNIFEGLDDGNGVLDANEMDGLKTKLAENNYTVEMAEDGKTPRRAFNDAMQNMRNRYNSDTLGGYFKKDEADLQEAFEKNELRNGCPILINKKRIKGSDVIMREFYTEIPEKIWDKRKNEIADSMNIHYVKKDKPFSHGKKANGRRIVMYSGVGREDPERGEIYDEQF